MFIHFLRHIIDIQSWCLLSETNRDLLFSTETIVIGVVAILLIETLSGNNSGRKPPGLHNIQKHGIRDETVEYALVMRVMIMASVTLCAFIVFCASDLRCNIAFPKASRTSSQLIGRVGWKITDMYVCPF